MKFEKCPYCHKPMVEANIGSDLESYYTPISLEEHLLSRQWFHNCEKVIWIEEQLEFEGQQS